MKLYLSSQGVGERIGDLQRMAADKPVAVIANAVDSYDRVKRRERVNKEIKDLGRIGLQAEELDLREHFGRPRDLQNKLALFGTVWIRGGNVFVLRRAMELSGFDGVALPKIREGSLVYAGYSAALAIAGPDLFGSELVDNPRDIPQGYPDGEPPTTGLNLLNYYLAPHHMTDAPWGPAVINYVDHMENNGRTVVPLRDGSVHIIDDSFTGPTFVPQIRNHVAYE